MNLLVVLPYINIDEDDISFVRQIAANYSGRIVLSIGSGGDNTNECLKTQKSTLPNVEMLFFSGISQKGALCKAAVENELAKGEPDGVVFVMNPEWVDGDAFREFISFCSNERGGVIYAGPSITNSNSTRTFRIISKITTLLYKIAGGISLNNNPIDILFLPKEHVGEAVSIKGNGSDYIARLIISLNKLNADYKQKTLESKKDHVLSKYFNGVADMIKTFAVIAMYLIKFLASSLICYGIDLGVYWAAITILGNKWGLSLTAVDSHSLATTIITGTWDIHITANFLSMLIARLISAPVNFFLNKKAVFNNNDKVGKTAVKYVLLAICQFTVTFLLVDLFVDGVFHVTGILSVLINGVVQICCFLFSFGIQKKWIFGVNGDGSH